MLTWSPRPPHQQLVTGSCMGMQGELWGRRGGVRSWTGVVEEREKSSRLCLPPLPPPRLQGLQGQSQRGGRGGGGGGVCGQVTGVAVVRDKRCKKRAREKAVVAVGVGPS